MQPVPPPSHTTPTPGPFPSGPFPPGPFPPGPFPPRRDPGARKDAIANRYARFYAPAALSVVTLAFLPLFEMDRVLPVGATVGIVHVSSGNIFELAGSPGGGPAMLGLFLLAVLIGLLVTAVFWARSVVIPVGISVLSLLLALLLITKPNAADDAMLSTAGTAGLVLVICLFVISVAHTIHLILITRPAVPPTS